MKQSSAETLVAQSSDARVSLWIHRDHDYPWLEYPLSKLVEGIGMSPLESPALGRLLREMRDVCPLTVEVQTIRLERETSTENDVIIVISSGAIPLVAHVPKISTVEEAHRLLAAMPAVPIVAVGDSLLSLPKWTKRWQKVRQSAEPDRSN